MLHQTILCQLTVNLVAFLAGNPCKLYFAPLGVKLSDHDLVQPDLMIVCDLAQIQSTHLEGPPQLVVEILSPSTVRHDRVRKLNLYGRVGVPEYWLVTQHPPMVEVLSNNAGLFTTVGAYTDKDTLLSPSFPTLRLDLGSVFADLPSQPPIDEVREYLPPSDVELVLASP